MINFILLLLGSLCTNTHQHDFHISNNTSIEFINTYFSRYQSQITGYEFETAQNSQYILNQTINNTHLCMSQCAYNDVCQGVYEYTGYNDNSTIYCNELSNLGHDPIESNNYSNSYTKFQVYNHEISNHSVDGYVLNIEEDDIGFPYNYTVFIDLNHNGIFDDGEPSNITNYGYFIFTDLNPGTYLVRTIPEDGCYVAYPGYDGSYNYIPNYLNLGDSYVYNVVNYYNHGNYLGYGPHGKLISNSSYHLIDSNFSFILGPNNDTYLQFYPDYGITLEFIDEVVHNTNGSDIFFTLYGNSTTYASVSVSIDNINYSSIGYLNTDNDAFDLENVSHPIRYISLNFYGSSNSTPLNIVNVYANERAELPPSMDI